VVGIETRSKVLFGVNLWWREANLENVQQDEGVKEECMGSLNV